MIYKPEEVNLHTHSFYCKHGTGTIREYVEEAEKRGRLKVLGFSEHCPLPDLILTYATRMDYEELPLYEKDILEEAEKSKLKILLGAECDWFKQEVGYYKDELLGKRNYNYLSCSIHSMPDPVTGVETYISKIGREFKKLLSKYVKLYVEALSSGLFTFGCHPDLFLSDYLEWDENAKAASKDIFACAKECGIPLEINDLGFRKPMIDTPSGKRPPYAVKEFWEMAKDEGVLVSINSDAHAPEDVEGHPVDGYANPSFKLAAEVGITPVSWQFDENGRIRNC